MMSLKPPACLPTVHNQAEREVEPRARWMQRYALTHGVVPVAVSKDVACTLKQSYGIPKCCIIPNGIPTADYAAPEISRSEWRAKQGFQDVDVLFVCVARFAPQKNHALLLEAFSRGLAGDPRAHLVLIGDGVFREQLTEHAKNLGLGSKVHFLGVRTDIADALNAMDVFVLSSDWEGNPLSVMEAMASGLPVISTAVGGVPDLLTSGKEGLLVKEKDVEGLAKAMTRLLGNAETRHAMGLASKQRAIQNFDVSRMIRDYEQLYKDLLERPYRLKAEELLKRRNLSLKEA
jgi:glycosyltransferase involved in cell wall biosynthesis